MSHIDPDILITRVIDGRDTPSDWQALDSVAATSAPLIYRDLALAQRDHRALSAQVQQQTAIAGNVSAPVHALNRDSENVTLSFEQARMAHRTRQVSTWAGWAAAAAIGMAFIGRNGLPVNQPGLSSSAGTAQLPAPVLNAADALEQYLSQGKQDGRVISQQPMRILGFEQLPDGAGYRVTYERPIVESAIVSTPYSLSAGKNTPAELGGTTSVQGTPVEPVKPPRKPTVQ